MSFDPARDTAALSDFRSRFAVPESVPLLGPFQGRLSDTGGKIELLQPDEPEGPDDPKAGLVPYELVERLGYSTSIPWPVLDRAKGCSLQRRAALSYGNEPTNWFYASPTPGGNQPLDSDGDLMPDAWEFADGLLALADDAAMDADHDARSNLAEFLAGTDPRDPLSVFRIASFYKDGRLVRIGFAAVEGQAYTLETVGALTLQNWMVATNLQAAPVSGQIELVVPADSAPTRIFRLKRTSKP